MNKIIFPLKYKMSRREVGDLHKALEARGFSVAEKEKDKHRFGATTRKAVLAFQEKFDLKSTGEVDEKTAVLLTREWSRRSRKPPKGERDDEDDRNDDNDHDDDDDKEKTFHIAGTVIDRNTNKGIAGLRIEPWHDGHRIGKVSGKSVTDKYGRFRINIKDPDLDEWFEDDKAEIDFKIFRGSEAITVEEDAVSWKIKNNKAEVRIVLELDAVDAEFRVQGQIRDADASSLAGVTVRAFDKDLRSEELLGETSTDDKGHYEIAYTADQFSRAEKHRADLIVRVFGSTSNTELVASEIIFSAQPVETVDLVVGNTLYRGPSEYTRFLDEITPLLSNVEISDLKEDDELQDISFLSGETGIEAKFISYLSASHQLAIKTELPPEVFYGFAREGLPITLPALLAQGQQGLRKALVTALRKNIIPAGIEASLEEILATLHGLIAQHAVEQGGKNEHSIANLVNVALEDVSKRDSFINRYVAHTGTIEQFWQSLRQDPDFGSEEIQRVQFGLQLGAVTGNHPPLVKYLMDLNKGGDLNSLGELVKWDRSSWITTFNKQVNGSAIGVPDDTPGEDDAGKIENYATSMVRIVESIFPTQAIAHQVHQVNNPEHQELIQFFNNNASFEIGTTNIEHYLSNGDATGGTTNSEKLTQQLKSMQRLYKLTPHYDHIKLMMNDGIHSAQTIATMGEQEFSRKYGDSLGNYTARQVFEKAEKTQIMATMLLTQYSAQYNAIEMPVLSGGAVEDVEGVPNWSTLFGSLDLCECQHCRSVYSPAAYLVDGLHFLSQRKTFGKSAKEVLFQRRGDIGTIELTCINTNTPLPYVDLVNELLETEVALRADEPQVQVPRQTTATAAELAANPEYFNEDAYDELAKAVYPQSLPFNLWIEEARAYLDHLGVQRHQLMRHFQSRPQPTDPSYLDITTEYLGLTSYERQVITNTLSPEKPAWDYWGVQQDNNSFPDPVDDSNIISGTWIKVLQHVRVFMHRSGIDYQDLTELLNTKYVNPTGEIKLVPVDSCDTQELGIDSLSEDTLNRAHRFIRLWRKLGWSMRDLDKTIYALRSDDIDVNARIDNDFILKLYHIEKLRSAFKLPIVTLLGLWSRINTVEDESLPGQLEKETSLYNQLFQSKTVTKPVDPVFTLNSAGTELEEIGPNFKISEHTETILAALEIVDAELAVLTTNVVTDDALNLANLSTLYRHILLTKTLNLSIKDFIILVDLVEIDPFDADHTENVLEFIDAVDKIRGSTFSIDQLDYLFRHQFQISVHVAPTEESIGVLLREVRIGLQKIVADHAFAPNPTGELAQKKLATIFENAILDVAIAIIEGSSTLAEAEQNIFIDTHFAVFLNLAQLTEIKVRLVGSAAEADKQKRYEAVLEPLLSYLRKINSERLIIQILGDALQVDTSIANGMLTHWVPAITDPGSASINDFLDLGSLVREQDNELLAFTSDEVVVDANGDPLNMAEKFNSYVRLVKIAMLVEHFKLDTEALSWLFANGQTTGYLNMAQLPIVETPGADGRFVRWSRLYNLIELRDHLQLAENGLLDLLDMARDSATTKSQYLTALSEVTQWSMENLEALCGDKTEDSDKGLLTLTYPEDYQDEQALHHLWFCFRMLRRLGLSAGSLGHWISADVTAENARSIIQTVKAKYDKDQWLTLARPLRDVLREKQRASLVAYLVARPYLLRGQYWHDANGLYQYFLIDVEMTPCQLTSRIKQANSAIQLFVQRCLMNLEPEVAANDTVDVKWRQWKWMKNYRVWEANRKVFLYPENWIEPSLRDNKSPLFKELESTLLQSDLDKDSAEGALITYLEGLDDVARLEVAGMYHQLERHGKQVVDLLHVFAHTQSIPHVYYYRQRVNADYWTPWEKVEVDIQSESIIPVIWNRRLYLFWPVFTLQTVEQSIIMPAAGKKLGDPRRYWKIEMAYSEYQNKKWSSKRISTNHFETILARNKDWPQQIKWLEDKEWIHDKDKGNYTFSSSFASSGRDLIIIMHLEQTERYLTPVVAFKYSACGDNPKIVPQYHVVTYAISSGPIKLTKDVAVPNTSQKLVAPTGTQFENMSFNEISDGDNKLYLRELFSDVPVLNKTPGTYRLMAQHHNRTTKILQKPFFFQDIARRFFVLPDRNIFVLRTAKLSDRIEVEWIDKVKDSITMKPWWQDMISSTSLIHNSTGTVFNPDDPLGNRPSYPTEHFEQAVMGSESVLTDETNLSSTTDSPMFMRNLGSTYMDVVDDSGMAVSKRFVTMMLRSVASDPMTRAMVNGSFEAVEAKPYMDIYGWARLFLKWKYQFETFYHPYVCRFIRELRRDGVEGLMQRALQVNSEQEISGQYNPLALVKMPFPIEDVDFTRGGAYSLYNWELFFHVPMMVADRLHKNQRFEDAMSWYHYIFDPTSTDTVGTDPEIPQQKYWITKPFFETTNTEYIKQKIQNLLQKLAEGTADSELEKQVEEWRDNPFNPHLVARMRTTAYQKYVVMKYIDNLIDWGDQLFRRDSMESVNEAAMLYILAAEILGPRPQKIQPRVQPVVQTYDELESQLGDFSNALVELENITPTPESGWESLSQDTPPLPPTLYFCVPKNDKLLGYWDTVADRLFKIRHCMNIEGVVRQMPLFEPPIDPAMLVKATAAGIDISSALNDINAALPHYRFNTVSRKASELCNEVKALGNALLSVLEKRDAEALGLLRSSQEIKLLGAIKTVRKRQSDEAKETLKGLKEYQKIVQAKISYYSSRPFMNEWEIAQTGLMLLGEQFRQIQASTNIAASVVRLIPNLKVGSPTTVGATFGGSNIAAGIEAFGAALGANASLVSTLASMSASQAGYHLRKDDWDLQKKLASGELEQVQKQITAAEIRLAIAEHELSNHELQIENAEKSDEFMRNKFTNKELYDWMVAQISGLYFQSYQLVYDVAKRAEQAFRHELGLQDSGFIQFGYWDSMKKGLLAGDRLYHDLKRMEVAYLDQNRREYELTKQISLSLLDPTSLLKLKETGKCFVNLPEILFDLESPGHYMRRIKSISVTIPCVTGPYTNVNCTLTLLKSSVRVINTLSGDKYARRSIDDERFIDKMGAIQSIVTSSAQNDAGLFNAGQVDDRYLPFEGAGVISEWQITLPTEFKQFDYDSITDVIMQINYTAREGGDALLNQANSEMQDAINETILSESKNGLFRMISARHEFPTEWHRFLHPESASADRQSLTIDLDSHRFPQVFREKTIRIKQLELFMKLTQGREIPLKLFVIRPESSEASGTLSSAPEFMNALAYTKISITGAHGQWAIEARDIDIEALPDLLRNTVIEGGVTHYRLKADVIEDLFLIINYTIV